MHAFNFVYFDFACYNKIIFSLILNIFQWQKFKLLGSSDASAQTIYIQCINPNFTEMNVNMCIVYKYGIYYLNLTCIIIDGRSKLRAFTGCGLFAYKQIFKFMNKHQACYIAFKFNTGTLHFNNQKRKTTYLN